MKYVSTRSAAQPVNFKQALFQGLAEDGGLFVPTEFPHYQFNTYPNSLTALAEVMLSGFIDDIPAEDLKHIIHQAMSFCIPLVHMGNNQFLLELFHGPTLSFKDVGARFMARAMEYYLSRDNKQIKIVVATSGDTGSAIAHAFHQLKNIQVYILYPSNKITRLQEQQMTTLGGNVHALEVQGTFDDCQRLVKQALSDVELKKHHHLTTANSINLARLLPQIVYHAWSVVQLNQQDPILIIPSGNLGNLTAAIYAKAVGMPIQQYIAACNANAVFPEFLNTGEFHPCASRHTLSNAMDVGNPSNIERIQTFFHQQLTDMQAMIKGLSISDETTLTQIRETYRNQHYILDPHTAVGMAAANATTNRYTPQIICATAHPAKFPEVIKQALNMDIELPPALSDALSKKKQSTLIQADYAALKSFIA